MKKIIIDCRYLGMSGIGRVLEGYILNLDNTKADFYFLGSVEKLNSYGITENIIADNNSPVSKKGMFISKQINSFDAFLTPNFIIPFGVKIPVYTLIHDLMFLDFLDTTNGFVDKKIKKYFYKRCLKKSKKIFTVSNFTKERIYHFFPKYKKDITVVYNGLSKSIIEYKEKHVAEPKENFIIFVGNIKKQKGLINLLQAVEKINSYDLYIVGNKDNFRTVDDSINCYLDNERIHFTGRIPDDEMYTLISKARYLVQPSLYEGFGLPPLEALFLGTKPIISDISIFKEIYNELDVVYFKAGDSDSLMEELNKKPNPVVETTENQIHTRFNFKSSIELIIKEILNEKK